MGGRGDPGRPAGLPGAAVGGGRPRAQHAARQHLAARRKPPAEGRPSGGGGPGGVDPAAGRGGRSDRPGAPGFRPGQPDLAAPGRPGDGRTRGGRLGPGDAIARRRDPGPAPRRTDGGARRPGPARAGPDQPPPQRLRRDGRLGADRDRGPGRRLPGRGHRRRLGAGDPRAGPAEDLRTVLHHQAGRQGDRPGPRRQLPDHGRPPRGDRRLEPAGGRRGLPDHPSRGPGEIGGRSRPREPAGGPDPGAGPAPERRPERRDVGDDRPSAPAP